MKSARIGLLLVLVSFVNGISAADDFPTRPLRIIVPYSAGSTADLGAREIAQMVIKDLKQQIIIDNRPGAGGNIGTEMGVRAAPDGYTVVMVNSATLGLNPQVLKTTSFDPLKDLVLLTIYARAGAILVVNANSSINSLKDLIASAKAKPGSLAYGSSGLGSASHLMAERLKKMAEIDLLHVPYKSETPVIADVIGGQVDLTFGFAFATLPLIASGKLRPIAVTTSKRLSALPNVPTIAESGFPGYDEVVWAGLAVPAATPAPIVQKLAKVFRSAVKTPDYQVVVAKRGSEPLGTTQEESAKLLKADYERYGKKVKELGLRIE